MGSHCATASARRGTPQLGTVQSSIGRSVSLGIFGGTMTNPCFIGKPTKIGSVTIRQKIFVLKGADHQLVFGTLFIVKTWATMEWTSDLKCHSPPPPPIGKKLNALTYFLEVISPLVHSIACKRPKRHYLRSGRRTARLQTQRLTQKPVGHRRPQNETFFYTETWHYRWLTQITQLAWFFQGVDQDSYKSYLRIFDYHLQKNIFAFTPA